MPRETLDLSLEVEHLSVLGPDGELDEELEPELEDETLRAIYRAMVLARRLDERMLELQRGGEIGTFAPVRGQEAAQVGAVAALAETDWMVPAFREIAAFVWRGLPLSDMLLYNAGYNEGAEPERARDLPNAVPVASQLPQAAGLGYAAKLGEGDEVVLTFFGDGATSEGDFHESLNFAQVFGCPTIFVCQNNQWAISVPREQQTRSETLAQKGLAHGMASLQVDGNDVLAMYVATKEAVDRARSGDGPTFIEAVTYRLSLHTTVDDPSRYRSEEEVEEWEQRDPVPRFRDYLKEKGVLDDDAIEEIDDDVADEVEAAWDEARERMDEAGAAELFDHHYDEAPPYLEAQRAAATGEARRPGAGGPGSSREEETDG